MLEADKAACRELAVRFFHNLDRGDYAELVALFTPGGTWRRAGALLSGREAILAAMQARPQGLRTRHLLANLLVEDDGGAATVHYELQVYAQVDDQPARLSQILSGADRLVHTDAAWRIQAKSAAPIFKFEAG